MLVERNFAWRLTSWLTFLFYELFDVTFELINLLVHTFIDFFPQGFHLEGDGVLVAAVSLLFLLVDMRDMLANV